MNLSKSFVIIFCVIALLFFGANVYVFQSTDFYWPWEPEKVTYVLPTNTFQSSSSQAPIVLHDDSTLVPEEYLTKETYVAGVCGSEIPASWHVRSKKDQEIWNREDGMSVPEVLRASDFFYMDCLECPSYFSPIKKPALWSVAASGTVLKGDSDDYGSEDLNRHEVDVLSLSKQEMNTLLRRSESVTDGFAWKTIDVDGHQLRVLRNVYPDGKYVGQELIFVPAEVMGGEKGIIIFNRSNYIADATSVAFRRGVQHFLDTLHFASCPRDWVL